jgi:hypothetical protein
VTGRQRAYFAIRGSAVVLFVASWSVVPPGALAGGMAITAGIIGMATCIGVNAGGPGERAGARMQSSRFERVRPPQGDWPPYDEDQIVDGEVLSETISPLAPPPE